MDYFLGMKYIWIGILMLCVIESWAGATGMRGTLWEKDIDEFIAFFYMEEAERSRIDLGSNLGKI